MVFELLGERCLHKQMPHLPNIEVPDYHGLTPDEIQALLDYAARHESNYITSAIVQTRFIEGIQGMTCPRPVEGPVRERSLKVDLLFSTNCFQGGTPELVTEFDRLLNWRQPQPIENH